MTREEFIININAPRNRVWKTLWNDDTYREWTSVFSPGSQAETDWQKGSKVLFTDGKGSGMVAEIADKKPDEYMAFRHLGEIKDGKEDLEAAKENGWHGAMEIYKLEHNDNDHTELTVQLDMMEEYRDMFMKTFPKALQRVKELAESNQ